MSKDIFGDGRLDAIEIKGPLTFADDTGACLAIQWAPMPVRGEQQTIKRNNCTITIDANGGTTSSFLLITLTIDRTDFTGTALADLVYTIEGGATKVEWAANAATAVTMKDVVDLIKELDGFNAWVLNARNDASVANDDFIDLAATALKTGTGVDGVSEILQRDVSAYTYDGDLVAWMRVGLPEPRDRSAFQLLDVSGTSAGITNGTIKAYRDDIDQFGETQEEYLSAALVAAQTSYIGDNKLEAAVVRGPLLIEVKSDDLTACSVRVKLIQASIGGM
jgi:hypothetical protein